MPAETTDRTPTIGTGAVWVDAPCPECGALVPILAVIRSVLTVVQDDTGSIRLRLKAKAVDHECRQLTIPGAIASATGVHLTITPADLPPADE